MSKPLQNKNHLLSLLDDLADLMSKDNQNSADQTAAINALKKAQKAATNDTKKDLTSLKGRITRFVKKNTKLLFGVDEKGTLKSNQTELALTDNPPKIQPLNKDASEEDLVNQAIRLGHDTLIRTEHAVSRQALANLDDETLTKLGFERVRGQTLKITLLADTKKKETAKAS